MQYHFCPRCKFRMIATKHLCPTCGYKIPISHNNNEESKHPAGADRFWSKLFKWELDARATNEKVEPPQEKPVLS